MPVELSENERERIKLEEEYRRQIREALEERHASRGSRFWKFLNSAFALWFLSAVLASAAGTIYARWSEAREAERKRRAACEALDLEIGYRLSYALVSLYRVQSVYEDDLHIHEKSPQEILLDQKQATTAVIHQLYYAPQGSFPPLYPEYAKFGLPALVTELRRNELDPEKQKELTVVLRRITIDSTDETIELPPKNWAPRIMEKYVLPRWTSDFKVRDPFTERQE